MDITIRLEVDRDSHNTYAGDLVVTRTQYNDIDYIKISMDNGGRELEIDTADFKRMADILLRD